MGEHQHDHETEPEPTGTRWQAALSAQLVAMRTQALVWWDKVAVTFRGTAPSAEPEVAAPAAAPGSAIYRHTAHPHHPRNVNRIHKQEQESAGFNTRVAVWLTKNVGTMQCAYLFAAIGIGSLVGVATNNVVLAAIFGSLSSYFLQLVLLPILSVGQNVLGRHAELQAEETFKTSQRSFHDIEEIMAHLSAQDDELLKHTKLLLRLAGEHVADTTSTAPAVTAPAVTTAVATRPANKARPGKHR